MSAPNITRWIGMGLLGLPLYGALTFWSSLHPRPDPNTHFEAWSRYVITDRYLLTHVLGGGLGLILAIFGTFDLGAYLATSRVGRLGLLAMVLTVFATALFRMPMGVSTFSAPHEGQAYRTGIRAYDKLPTIFADTLEPRHRHPDAHDVRGRQVDLYRPARRGPRLRAQGRRRGRDA